MSRMTFSTIDEPIALTGKIYHKDSLLTSRPYLMLCLPISIDDCSYIYNKLSQMVNYSLDPNAPLYIGHLAIAAINDVSYISSDDRKYSIKINSRQSDQNYEFSCKGGVDYDKWLYYLNQAHKITNGEVGRKLRFCNILFNKESSGNRDYIRVTKDDISPVRRDRNESYTNSTISSNTNFDDMEVIGNMPRPNRPTLLFGNNPDDSFNYNYLCSEKYIENYNKEKENELQDSQLKALGNKESTETLLNDTQNREDKIQKKTSQSFHPDIDDITQVNHDTTTSSSTVNENEKPIGRLMNTDIFYDNKIDNSNGMKPAHNTINKTASGGLNEITPLNYGDMNSNHKINVMNQPIINNNINVINSSIPNLNPLLNSATGNTFNPTQGISYPAIPSAEPPNALINNTNSKMNHGNLTMGFNTTTTNSNSNALPNPLPVLAQPPPPLQISTQPSNQNSIPFDLPRQPAFYNPSTSNPDVYHDINKALYGQQKGADSSTPHSIPMIPPFYNSSSPAVPSSPLDLNKPNLPTPVEPSSPYSLPRHSAFYKQVGSVGSQNVNSVPNLNRKVINNGTPNTLPRYPPVQSTNASSSPTSPTSSTSSTRFNRQYEEQNKTLPRTSKKSEQPKKKFQSLPRYNSYKVTITRFKSIFSSNKNKVNRNISKTKKNNK
ncbi:hypothetical protein PIROE2DRAFT_18959 [Piromyces sp. E2]|nr:hypothetical protein PIROE2DRAFT_18959 [Piromyces sp. E2]|eukprot:OUM56440.1 hypothetical protein PIROE2DRAFT_18959 [Piromyces sp. E2]